MKKFIAAITLGLLFFGLPGAHSQNVLTLKDAISIGLENNYSIRIARNNADILVNNADRGNAGFLPILNLNSQKSYSIDDVEQQFLNDPAPRRIDNANTNNFAITPIFQWTIFDGFGMFITYDKLNELREEGEENAKVVVENTIAAISSNFFLIALEEARLEVLRNAIEISKERLKIAKDKYELGKASKLEFLAAQVDYNTDSTALINQDVTIFTAKANLNELMGRDPASNFRVEFDIDLIQGLQLNGLLNSLNLRNPNLLAAQRRKNAAYLEVKEIQAERFPIININSSYNYGVRNSDAGFLISNRTSGFTYGASASVNLFNGFNLSRRVQNAKISVLNAELGYEQLQLQLQRDIQTSYTMHQKNIILMDLELANQEVARENAEIALERYRLGVSNSLELREAQRSLVEAETRALTATYNAKISEIELLRLSGEIIQYSGLKMP
jgi:outer membrane protein